MGHYDQDSTGYYDYCYNMDVQVLNNRYSFILAFYCYYYCPDMLYFHSCKEFVTKLKYTMGQKSSSPLVENVVDELVRNYLLTAALYDKCSR